MARKLENTWETSDQEVLNIIDELLLEERKKFYLSLKRMEELRKELFRSLRKMDVLEELLEDDTITEIMVNRWDQIFIEREGHLILWPKTFTSPKNWKMLLVRLLPDATG